MKGQVAYEAVWAVTLVFIAYAAAVAWGTMLNDETTWLRTSYADEAACDGLSAIIDEVYYGGAGASAVYEADREIAVGPGTIELGTTYCFVEGNAVKRTWNLGRGAYVVRNGGDGIVFEERPGF